MPEKDSSPGIEFKPIHLIPRNPFTKNGYVTINDDIFPSVSEEPSTGSRNDKKLKSSKQKLWASTGIVASILLCFLVVLSFGKDKVRQTMIRITAFRQVTHPETPSPLWGTVVKPFPTGAFWTNLVVKNGDLPVGVYPYGVKTTDAGVQVSYGASRRAVSQIAITDPFVADLSIGSAQAFVGRAVESYDNTSVTICYRTAVNGKYRTHLVKGSPFITVVYENATPVITSALMKIQNVEARVVRGSSGVQYIVTLGNFQKWLVYCSDPVALTWKDNTLSSPNPIRGYVRVAILPVQNAEASFNMLLNYVQKYATGAAMTLGYPLGTLATVSWQFTVVGNGPLLMLALPHHAPLMVYPIDCEENRQVQAAFTPVWSIKGKLKAVIGERWTLQYNTVSVGWNYALTDKLSTYQMDEIAKQLLVDVKSIIPSAIDPYTFGKELGRMARLAQIADNLGIADARQQALQAVETALTPWLQGLNPDALLYDKTYGGVITTNGVADLYADYGSGWYSDHHFHYGYFAYAAATLAKLDVPYWEANKVPMETIIRDFCNPDPTDPDFPFARHKDFFDGHSWASGLYPQANGKGQESSSEAVNAYYGVYLYALATANVDLTHFSHLLLSMEVQATQFYWHMSNDDIYDSVFSASRMAGNIGALDVTASTWFGSELEFVHGINLMPVTPATALLFDQPYVMVQWPVLAGRLPPPVPSGSKICAANPGCAAIGMSGLCCPTPEGSILACCDGAPGGEKRMQDEWKSLMFLDHAVVDRDVAWNQIKSITGFGPGGSKSNSLFWAASRNPPPPNYNGSAHGLDIKGSIKQACSANSACDAVGITGMCCPTEGTSTAPGVMLGCCPILK